MIEQGTVVNVYTEPAAATAVIDHAIGVQVLQVDDAFPFGEGNGQLEVNGVVLDYTSVDMDLDTITLESTLAAAVPSDTKVYVYPRGEQRVAMVTLDDGEEGVRALITNPEKWVEGIRAPGEEETVNIDDATGQWVITTADEEIQKISADYLPPLGDLEIPAPGSTPVPVVVGGVGALYVSYAPVTDAPFVSMNVYIDDASGSVFAPGNLVRTVDGTFAAITHMPDGSPLDPATTYWIVIEAFNETDAAPPSAEVEGTLKLVDTPDISVTAAWVGTMTVDRLISGFQSAEAILIGDGGARAIGADGREVGFNSTGFDVIGPTSLGNPVYIDFPTDGGPNIISGKTKAGTLEVEGDPVSGRAASFFRTSRLEEDAMFLISSGDLEPPVAPTITGHIPKEANITGGTGSWYPGVWDGGDLLFLERDDIFNNKLRRITFAGSISTERTFAHPAGAGATTPWWCMGITRSGTDWFLLEYRSPSGTVGGGILTVRKFNSSWVNTANWTVTGIATHDVYQGAFGVAGTNLFVVCPNHSGALDYFKASLASLTPTTGGTLPVTNADLLDGEYIKNIQQGSLGTGTGSDFYLMTNQRALWFSGGASPSAWPDGYHDFNLPAGASGTVWDATSRFWTVTEGSPSQIRKHALAHPDVNHWACATKYNSVGPKETTVSEKVSFKPQQRKFIKLTTSYPGAPGGRVYVATNATEPADASFKLAGTVADPNTAVSVDAFAGIVGGAPPATNTYTGTSPATVAAVDGGLWFDGVSDGELGTGGFRDDARTIRSSIQTANYTPVYADAFKMVQLNIGSPSTITLTIPPDVFLIDQWFEVYWRGTGTSIIVPGSGVTLNGRGLAGAITTMNFTGRHGVIRLLQRASNIWVASGDIGAVS